MKKLPDWFVGAFRRWTEYVEKKYNEVDGVLLPTDLDTNSAMLIYHMSMCEEETDEGAVGITRKVGIEWTEKWLNAEIECPAVGRIVVKAQIEKTCIADDNRLGYVHGAERAAIFFMAQTRAREAVKRYEWAQQFLNMERLTSNEWKDEKFGEVSLEDERRAAAKNVQSDS